MKMLTALLSSSILVLISCNHPTTPSGVTESSIAFSIEYYNYSWGYFHSGCFIDRVGRVFTFNQGTVPASDSICLFEEDGTLSPSELEKIYSSLKASDTLIPPDTIALMVGLISDVNTSDTGTASAAGADMGEITYQGYLFDSATQAYKPIFLKEHGDVVKKNRSPAAEVLSAWLEARNFSF
jgi:hypothetical protein